MYKRNDDYENNIAQYLYTVWSAIYIVHSETLRRQQIIVNNVYDVIKIKKIVTSFKLIKKFKFVYKKILSLSLIT